MKKYKTKPKDAETAIERFCLHDCCNGDKFERDNCINADCQLWGFRFRQTKLEDEVDMKSVVEDLIAWNEKYPPSNIYSHDNIVVISSEMNEIYRKAKDLLNVSV